MENKIGDLISFDCLCMGSFISILCYILTGCYARDANFSSRLVKCQQIITHIGHFKNYTANEKCGKCFTLMNWSSIHTTEYFSIRTATSFLCYTTFQVKIAVKHKLLFPNLCPKNVPLTFFFLTMAWFHGFSKLSLNY